MTLLLVGIALAAEVLVGMDAPSVQAAIDRAEAGDVVVLPEGDWPGPVVVDKAIVLTSRGGVLVGDVGRTLTLAAPGVVVAQLAVRGSGDDLMGPDACVRIEPAAVGAVVASSHLSNCLFGVWVHTTPDVAIVGNLVEGRPGEPEHRKGNGIHLFDATRATVQANTVTGARDGVYVSATEDSLIADNQLSYMRFGVHYMYSSGNVVRGNTATHNGGGFALMQSHRITVLDNVASDNERHGVLFRDAQYCEIGRNTVERNGEGMFFFSSLDNDIHDNRFAFNQIGARVWAGSERNRVTGNAFVANRQQVFYVAAEDQHWSGNHFSDHLAWDQDRDGVADRPYRADALTAGLLYRYPAAVLLLSSPALEILRQLQGRIPALRVPSIIDDAPVLRRGESP